MIYSSLQGISGVQEWKQFSEYLLSSWWWPSPSWLELLSADKVRNLRLCLAVGAQRAPLTLESALHWPELAAPPALGAGDVTLCAGVGGLSPCDRRAGQQCLPEQPWAGAEAAGAAGALGGAGAATKGLCLEKGAGEADQQRGSVPGSLPELVTRSCSSAFFIPRVASPL